MSTASRSLVPNVRIDGVALYPDVFSPGKLLLSGTGYAGRAGSSKWIV